MNKIMRRVLIMTLLPTVLPVPAMAVDAIENRAVNINIGSVGGKLDGAALRAVRQLVGYGIASGVVDTFTVYSPKAGAVPVEGGLGACAEAGFAVNKTRFNAFIQDLKTIRVKTGSFYNVTPALDCTIKDPVVCTMDIKTCPDGSFVGRTAPSCAFPACPDVKK